MFYLYISRLKCLFRNKGNMFWCYLFPIVLATCFFFAFNNLWGIDSFETISIAYDNEGAIVDPLKEAMEQAEMAEGVPIFDITYTDQNIASELLEKEEIEAYIVGSTDPELFIKQNGMNETIIKSFLDNYHRVTKTIESILSSNPDALEEGLLEDVLRQNTFVYEKEDSKKTDQLLIYFFSLLAFACLFGSNWGFEEAINIQADQSLKGARLNVSPINKMKLFYCNMMAAFTVHCGSILLLFLYLIYVIKIDFGINFVYIISTCLAGSLNGLALGATIAVWVKNKREIKEGILTSVVLGGAFLSGMMFPNMKYIIATRVPFLAYINPVNLVTDALYSLNYYDTYDRFYLDFTMLCVMTIVFGVLSYIGIRRKNYASI